MVPIKSFSDQQVNPIAAAHFLAAQQQVHMLRNSNSIVGRYSSIDYDVIMTSVIHKCILAARVNALQQQAAAQMQQAAIQQAAAEIRNRAVSAKMREQWHLQQQLQNTAIMQEVLKQKAARPMMTPTPPTHPQLRSPHGKLPFISFELNWCYEFDWLRARLRSINMKIEFIFYLDPFYFPIGMPTRPTGAMPVRPHGNQMMEKLLSAQFRPLPSAPKQVIVSK